MKQIIKFLVLALIITACSSKDNPEKLLRTLMKNEMQGMDITESTSDGKLVLTDKDESNALEGTFIFQNEDLLVVSLTRWFPDMVFNPLTGIFSREDGKFKSLFSSDLISGKLDTLIDLNGDNTYEIVIDQVDAGSAGAKHRHVLFAKLEGKTEYEQIGILATNFEGYARFGWSKENPYISSAMKFRQTDKGIVIDVRETHSWDDPEREYETKSDNRYIFIKWLPPDLEKRIQKPDMQAYQDRILSVLNRIPSLNNTLHRILKSDNEKKSGRWLSVNADYFLDNSTNNFSIKKDGEWFTIDQGDEMMCCERTLIHDVTINDSIVTFLITRQAQYDPELWNYDRDDASEYQLKYTSASGILDDGIYGWAVSGNLSGIPAIFDVPSEGEGEVEGETPYQYINNERIEITRNAAPLYYSPGGTIIGTLPSGVQCILINKGEQVTIDGQTGSWYEVDYILEKSSSRISGVHGWVFGPDTSKGES